MYMPWSMRCCSKSGLSVEDFLVCEDISDSLPVLARFWELDWIEGIVQWEAAAVPGSGY